MRLLNRPRTFLWVILLVLMMAASACARPYAMPSDAREALLAYWDSLPSAPGIENEIVRAWQGTPPDGADPAMKIWCVESEMWNDQDADFETTLVTWIVVRQDSRSDWTAAMLMTMSSTWPYEACGEGLP